jgi:outer membrane autotransporter protein
VFDTISTLPESQIPGALNALLPGLASAGIDIMPAIMRAMSGVVKEQSGQNGGSSGDPTQNDKFMWMKPFAVNVNQDSDGGVSGYDANIGGVVLGADDQISANTRAGWTIGYAQTNLDGNDAYNGQSLDMNTYQLGLYARKEDGDVFTTGKIRFGWNSNDSSRDTGFGTAKADYDSWYGMLNATIGKTYASDGITVSPELSVTYVYIDQEGYTEHGSNAPLKVDGQNQDSLVFSLGGKATMGVLTAHLEVGFETLNDQTDISSTFVGGGPSFTTDGTDQGNVIVTTGLGLNLMQDQPLNISINYDAAIRDQYNDQEISATFRYKW